MAADPSGYLRGLPRPVLIDEYQYVPEVLSVIKADLSTSRERAGDWLLCGSVAIDAVTAAADSLGGRLSDVAMGTLTLDERRDLPSPGFLRRLLQDGPGFLSGWRPPARLDRAELLTEAAAGGFPLAVAEARRGGSARRVLSDWVSAAGPSGGGTRHRAHRGGLVRELKAPYA